MPTGLIIAINASQLISRTEDESTAQHLRPSHFTNAHTLSGAALAPFERGTILDPQHFINPHTLNGARLIGDVVFATLKPSHFTNAHTLNGAKLTASEAPDWIDLWLGGGGHEAISGFADRTFRARVPAAALLNLGSKVRVTFKAGGDAMTIGNAFFGVGTSSGDDWDFASAPARLTFNGGDHDAALDPGEEITSDELEFPVTGEEDLLISFYNEDSDQPFFMFPNDQGGAYGWYSSAGVDDAGTADASGYGTSEVRFAVYGLLKWEVFGTTGAAPGGPIYDPLGDLIIYHFNFEADVPGDVALNPLSYTVGGQLVQQDDGPPGDNVLAWQFALSSSNIVWDEADDGNFTLLDLDWTFEGFLNVPASWDEEIIAYHGSEAFTGRQSFKLYAEDSILKMFLNGDAGQLTVEASDALATATWQHAAITRAGTTIRIFIDGEMVGSDTFNDSVRVPFSVEIRNALQNSVAGALMDDWRFTKGFARYSDDAGFTPPARPLPLPFKPSGDQLSHKRWRVLVLDNNGSGFTSIGSKLAMFASSDGSGTNLVTGGSIGGSNPGGAFGNSVAGLIDGNDVTQWATGESGNDYVDYNFPAPVELHSITMKVSTAGGQEGLMPSHFKILRSDDGVSYVEELEVTGENWTTGASERTYSW